MTAEVSTGNFSQRYWPGRGGGALDDCAPLADFRSATAANPGLKVPSLSTYREKAGVPDTDTGIEGMSVDHSLKAATAVWPSIRVELYFAAWSGWAAKVKAGAVASTSVMSAYLPEALRYGFNLTHRITVYWTGTAWKVLNPLAPPHSKPQTIAEADLKLAMVKYPTVAEACAVLFWPKAA